MTIRFSLCALTVSALVFALACGGGGDKAKTTTPADPAGGTAEADKPAEQPKADDTAAATDATAADKPADPPSGDKILAFVSAMADIADANAADCDAMGDKLNAHLDTDPALIKYMNSMSGTDTHKAWLKENKDAYGAISKKMMSIGKCISNPKVKAAMGKFN